MNAVWWRGRLASIHTDAAKRWSLNKFQYLIDVDSRCGCAVAAESLRLCYSQSKLAIEYRSM
jgi:hypothetical protein